MSDFHDSARRYLAACLAEDEQRLADAVDRGARALLTGPGRYREHEHEAARKRIRAAQDNIAADRLMLSRLDEIEAEEKQARAAADAADKALRRQLQRDEMPAAELAARCSRVFATLATLHPRDGAQLVSGKLGAWLRDKGVRLDEIDEITIRAAANTKRDLPDASKVFAIDFLAEYEKPALPLEPVRLGREHRRLRHV